MVKKIVYIAAVIVLIPRSGTASIHAENRKVLYLNRSDEQRIKVQRGVILLPGNDIRHLDSALSTSTVPIWVRGPLCRSFFRSPNTHINRNNWIFFYDSSQDNYVLIPKKYVLNHVSPQTTIKLSTGQTMPIEWGFRLGFRNNIFKVIDSSLVGTSLLRSLTDRIIQQFKSNPSPHTIFITNQEYRSAHRTQDIPEWTIYILGHGLSRLSICELNIPKFKNLLDFCEKHILTRLLAYVSCYSGGINEKKIYTDHMTTYSFPIITAGSGDTVSYLVQIRFQDFFDAAFQLTWNNESYLSMGQAIGLDIPKNRSQIRLPGMSWFSPLDIAKKTYGIGNIRAATCTPEKPITITVPDPSSNHLAVLIYTTDIPCNIHLPDTIDPYYVNFISMIPGAAIHYIHSITIPIQPRNIYNIGNKLKVLLDNFHANTSWSSFTPKIFLIDTITLYDKKVQNVLITPLNPLRKYWYFEFENKIYASSTDPQHRTTTVSFAEAQWYRLWWKIYYNQIKKRGGGESGKIRANTVAISQILEKKLADIRSQTPLPPYKK